MPGIRPALAMLVTAAFLGHACATAPVEGPRLADVLASMDAARPSESPESAPMNSDASDGTVGGPASDVPTSPVPGDLTSAPQSESAAEPTASEFPPEPPPHSDFPLEASLAKTCVLPGGEMTITVKAGRKTGVGYHAIYAGGQGGAEPPYGEGHGGNGGDLTDENGRYRDTWVVSPTAPIGPARVDVVAGRDGGFATAVLRFVVADPADHGCP